MITPIQDKVIILPDPAEEETASGIIIPDTAKKRQLRGEVISVPQEGEHQVKPGDKVYFAQYCGIEIEHDSTAYLVLEEKDILAIITNP